MYVIPPALEVSIVISATPSPLPPVDDKVSPLPSLTPTEATFVYDEGVAGRTLI